MIPLVSPYKDRFDEILMKVRESGFLSKWKGSLMTTLEFKFAKYSPQEDRKNAVYTLRELKFVFECWIFCCGISVIVFIMEIIWFRARNLDSF